MQKNDRIAIKKWDWLLILGVTTAPMTLLRIWKIGPGEVLCLLWSVRYFSGRRIKRTFVIHFFLLFYMAMLVGAVICSFVSPGELREVDFFTWLYLAIIASVAYKYFSTVDVIYCKKFLFSLSVVATLWYISLFFYSITFSRNFLGVSLWYSTNRFAGGGNNPHQLAAFNCALFFCFSYFLLKGKKRIISILGMLINMFLLIATKSSTGYLAIFVGLLVVLAYLNIHYVDNVRARNTLFVLMVFAIVVVTIVFHQRISRMVIEWILSDENGMRRLYLFSHIGVTFSKSPIFGLGPGAHSIDYVEYHNSYLEILAAGGIVGIFALIQMSIYLYRKLSYDSALLPIAVSLYTYGVAGFVMRRIIFWIPIAVICAIAEKNVITNGSID